jgi:thioredoxin reductase (NADPH)
MAAALAPLAAELGFSVEHVDVDAEAALEARYGEKVPVLADPAGREICHGHLDVEALRRHLAVE